MELSKEYFDRQLAAQTDRLEKKIEQEVHGLAAMVGEGFADPEKPRDVKERVDVLEKRTTKIESVLDIRL